MSSRLIASLLILGVGASACRKSEPQVRPDDEHAGPQRVKCTLPEGDTLVGAVTVPARCDLEVGKLLRVPAGASLEIGAGAHLSFAKGAGLIVEGGSLRARGTAQEPIVFGSAGATRAPGDWTGIVFARRPVDPALAAKLAAGEDAAVPPHGHSIVEHAIVEHGGWRANMDSYDAYTAGIDVAPFPGDTVALSHVRLRHNAGAGLHVEHADDVTKLEAIAFGPNDGTSARVPIALAAALGVEPTETVRLHGSLATSVVLPKPAKSYLIHGVVSVRATKAPVTLEIAAGTIVQLAKASGLSLSGHGATAKLVAHGVTFTSAEAKPAPGDWRGIDLSGDVATDLDAIVVEHAGGIGKTSRAAIRLPSDDSKVKLVGSTFRDNAGAAVESWNDCKPWESPARKNTSIGKPLCEENPLMKPLSISSLGVLGALGSGPSGSFSELFKDEPTSMIGNVALGSGGLGSSGSGYGGGGAAGIGGGGGLGLGGGGGGGIGSIGTGGGSKASSRVVETSITATGALPIEVVRRLVRARTSSLRACHGGSSASGTITVSFTIDAKGKVGSATAASGTLTDASIRACVRSVFERMAFPTAEAGGTTSATATHRYETL